MNSSSSSKSSNKLASKTKSGASAQPKKEDKSKTSGSSNAIGPAKPSKHSSTNSKQESKSGTKKKPKAQATGSKPSKVLKKKKDSAKKKKVIKPEGGSKKTKNTAAPSSAVASSSSAGAVSSGAKKKKPATGGESKLGKQSAPVGFGGSSSSASGSKKKVAKEKDRSKAVILPKGSAALSSAKGGSRGAKNALAGSSSKSNKRPAALSAPAGGKKRQRVSDSDEDAGEKMGRSSPKIWWQPKKKQDGEGNSAIDENGNAGEAQQGSSSSSKSSGAAAAAAAGGKKGQSAAPVLAASSSCGVAHQGAAPGKSTKKNAKGKSKSSSKSRNRGASSKGSATRTVKKDNESSTGAPRSSSNAKGGKKLSVKGTTTSKKPVTEEIDEEGESSCGEKQQKGGRGKSKNSSKNNKNNNGKKSSTSPASSSAFNFQPGKRKKSSADEKKSTSLLLGDDQDNYSDAEVKSGKKLQAASSSSARAPGTSNKDKSSKSNAAKGTMLASTTMKADKKGNSTGATTAKGKAKERSKSSNNKSSKNKVAPFEEPEEEEMEEEAAFGTSNKSPKLMSTKNKNRRRGGSGKKKSPPPMKSAKSSVADEDEEEEDELFGNNFNKGKKTTAAAGTASSKMGSKQKNKPASKKNDKRSQSQKNKSSAALQFTTSNLDPASGKTGPGSSSTAANKNAAAGAASSSANPFASSSYSLFGPPPTGSANHSSYYLGGGGSSSSSRWANTVNGLKDKKTRFVSLTELNETLQYCSEDMLLNFPMETAIPNLLKIVEGDSNANPFEIADPFGGGGMGEDQQTNMILSCRILYTLIDIVPPTTRLISTYKGIPILVQKLMQIDFIDVAEQVISVIDKIVDDCALQVLQANGLMAILQFLDFFHISLQRKAVSSASKMLGALSVLLLNQEQAAAKSAANAKGGAGGGSSASSLGGGAVSSGEMSSTQLKKTFEDQVRPVLPQLSSLLTHPDAQVTTTVCECWRKVLEALLSLSAVESSRAAILAGGSSKAPIAAALESDDQSTLEEICPTSVIENFLQLIEKSNYAVNSSGADILYILSMLVHQSVSSTKAAFDMAIEKVLKKVLIQTNEFSLQSGSAEMKLAALGLITSLLPSVSYEYFGPGKVVAGDKDATLSPNKSVSNSSGGKLIEYGKSLTSFFFRNNNGNKDSTENTADGKKSGKNSPNNSLQEKAVSGAAGGSSSSAVGASSTALTTTTSGNNNQGEKNLTTSSEAGGEGEKNIAGQNVRRVEFQIVRSKQQRRIDFFTENGFANLKKLSEAVLPDVLALHASAGSAVTRAMSWNCLLPIVLLYSAKANETAGEHQVGEQRDHFGLYLQKNIDVMQLYSTSSESSYLAWLILVEALYITPTREKKDASVSDIQQATALYSSPGSAPEKIEQLLRSGIFSVVQENYAKLQSSSSSASDRGLLDAELQMAPPSTLRDLIQLVSTNILTFTVSTTSTATGAVQDLSSMKIAANHLNNCAAMIIAGLLDAGEYEKAFRGLGSAIAENEIVANEVLEVILPKLLPILQFDSNTSAASGGGAAFFGGGVQDNGTIMLNSSEKSSSYMAEHMAKLRLFLQNVFEKNHVSTSSTGNATTAVSSSETALLQLKRFFALCLNNLTPNLVETLPIHLFPSKPPTALLEILASNAAGSSGSAAPAGKTTAAGGQSSAAASSALAATGAGGAATASRAETDFLSHLSGKLPPELHSRLLQKYGALEDALESAFSSASGSASYYGGGSSFGLFGGSGYGGASRQVAKPSSNPLPPHLRPIAGCESFSLLSENVKQLSKPVKIRLMCAKPEKTEKEAAAAKDKSALAVASSATVAKDGDEKEDNKKTVAAAGAPGDKTSAEMKTSADAKTAGSSLLDASSTSKPSTNAKSIFAAAYEAERERDRANRDKAEMLLVEPLAHVGSIIDYVRDRHLGGSHSYGGVAGTGTDKQVIVYNANGEELQSDMSIVRALTEASLTKKVSVASTSNSARSNTKNDPAMYPYQADVFLAQGVSRPEKFRRIGELAAEAAEVDTAGGAEINAQTRPPAVLTNTQMAKMRIKDAPTIFTIPNLGGKLGEFDRFCVSGKDCVFAASSFMEKSNPNSTWGTVLYYEIATAEKKADTSADDDRPGSSTKEELIKQELLKAAAAASSTIHLPDPQFSSAAFATTAAAKNPTGLTLAPFDPAAHNTSATAQTGGSKAKKGGAKDNSKKGAAAKQLKKEDSEGNLYAAFLQKSPLSESDANRMNSPPATALDSGSSPEMGFAQPKASAGTFGATTSSSSAAFLKTFGAEHHAAVAEKSLQTSKPLLSTLSSSASSSFASLKADWLEGNSANEGGKKDDNVDTKNQAPGRGDSSAEAKAALASYDANVSAALFGSSATSSSVAAAGAAAASTFGKDRQIDSASGASAAKEKVPAMSSADSLLAYTGKTAAAATKAHRDHAGATSSSKDKHKLSHKIDRDVPSYGEPFVCESELDRLALLIRFSHLSLKSMSRDAICKVEKFSVPVKVSASSSSSSGAAKEKQGAASCSSKAAASSAENFYKQHSSSSSASSSAKLMQQFSDELPSVPSASSSSSALGSFESVAKQKSAFISSTKTSSFNSGAASALESNSLQLQQRRLIFANTGLTEAEMQNQLGASSHLSSGPTPAGAGAGLVATSDAVGAINQFAQQEQAASLVPEFEQIIVPDAKLRSLLEFLAILYHIGEYYERLAVMQVWESTNGLSVQNLFNTNVHFLEKLESDCLTTHALKQLHDPVSVASRCCAKWLMVVANRNNFLFSKPAKKALHQGMCLGLSRALNYAQNRTSQQSNNNNTSNSNNNRILAPIPRQKVRIQRHRMLDSAIKLMSLYSTSPAILEVEFSNEVGTGSGPTLEFYSTVVELLKQPVTTSRHGNSNAAILPMDSDPDNVRPPPTTQSQPSQGQSQPASSSNAKRSYAVKTNLFRTAHSSPYLFPNPLTAHDDKQVALSYFKLLGQLVGKALLDQRLLDLPLHPLFWRMVKSTANEPSMFSTSDLRLIDLELFESLNKLRILNEDDLEDLELTFVLPGYEGYSLCDAGEDRLVTKANLSEYISLVAYHVLYGSIRQVILEFRQAFLTIHTVESLRIFSEHELSQLIVGASSRDNEFWTLEHLTKHIIPAHGFTRESSTYADLLTFLTELSFEKRKLFLSFVTGAHSLPVGGFAGLKPQLQVVKKEESSPDLFLPSVMTCANYLKMPQYSTPEILEKKMLQAISGDGQSFLLS